MSREEIAHKVGVGVASVYGSLGPLQVRRRSPDDPRHGQACFKCSLISPILAGRFLIDGIL
jgi:hypothetical protein